MQMEALFCQMFQLIVGSDDFDLRVYKDDVMIGEVTETEVATSLSPLRANKMAYALANGTVGVYHKLHRMWRVKVRAKNNNISPKVLVLEHIWRGETRIT